MFDQSFTYLRKFMDGNVLVVTNITHFLSCLSIIFSHLILKSLPKEAFFYCKKASFDFTVSLIWNWRY